MIRNVFVCIAAFVLAAVLTTIILPGNGVRKLPPTPAPSASK